MLKLTEVIRSRTRLSTLSHWTQDPCSLSHTSCWALAPLDPNLLSLSAEHVARQGHLWNGDPLFSQSALAVKGGVMARADPLTNIFSGMSRCDLIQVP